MLDFRVRPHDSELEASRGKSYKSLATEKGKDSDFFHEYSPEFSVRTQTAGF